MNIIKGKDYPYYHVGLGIWIKSKKHLSQYMNSKGIEEVGTEDTRLQFKGMSRNDIRKMVGKPLVNERQKALEEYYG